jgi:hypothetical protein
LTADIGGIEIPQRSRSGFMFDTALGQQMMLDLPAESHPATPGVAVALFENSDTVDHEALANGDEGFRV